LKVNHIIKCSLFLLIILVFSINTASAFNRYDENIHTGDGYQINNYFIEVTEIKTSGDDHLLTVNIYLLKSDGTYEELTTSTESNLDGKRQTKYESGTIEIMVTEKNITSQYAIVDIITSGITVEYNKAIDGGVSKAEFIGEPSILLTKKVGVDQSNIEIGDIIRVTIEARNVGSGPAKRINIDHGITPGFTFKSDIFTTYPDELAVSNEYTQMYIYEIEAAKNGTFTLNPATITYYCSTYDSEYSSTSNSPTVTVAEESVETADLELTVIPDKIELQRGEKVTFTVSVRNVKEVPATTVRIDVLYPNELSYESGSEAIRIIDNKPVVQENIYGARFEEEYQYTFLAEEVGIYNLTVKLTYNDGVNNINKEVTSSNIYIEQGEYDYLPEYPIYVYVTPIIIIIAIAGWLYWRRSQFRM